MSHHLGRKDGDCRSIRLERTLADLRRVDRPAIGDRRVGNCQLERSRERATLADRKVHRVTTAVESAIGAIVARDRLEIRGSGGVGLGNLRVAALCPRTVDVLHILVGVREQLPGLDASAGFTGQVDAGPAAEPEGQRHVDQRILRLGDRMVAAISQPVVVSDPIEHRVAGDLDGAAERDRSIGLGFEVLEGSITDLQCRRTRNQIARAHLRAQSSGRRGQFECGTRRVTALHRTRD